MFIRVTRFTSSEPIDEQRMAASAQRMAETLGPLPGYLGWSALADPTRLKAASVTYWADAATMQASEEAGAALRARVLSEGSQLIDLERHEFLIQERTAPPTVGTFARVTELTVQPERIDELISSMNATTVSQVKAQPGFHSFLVGANREAGKVLVASVWQSAAAREASDVGLRDERRQTIERFGLSVKSIELYEVVAAEVKLPAPA